MEGKMTTAEQIDEMLKGKNQAYENQWRISHG
jgi:hypothetical protein